MATSTTVIVALRYADGIVVGADSQASDQNANVRWPVEKLHQVGSRQLVLGFSGSLGQATRARGDIESFGWQSTTFKRSERVRKALVAKAAPYLKDGPESRGLRLWGIAVYGAQNETTILEVEPSGDDCVHEYFHAIGSGAQTAYAIWRTIGGRELEALDEGLALHVVLRILQTCVDVEMTGVSGPFNVYVVSANGTRRLSTQELASLEQAVHEWQRHELDRLLGRQMASETAQR